MEKSIIIEGGISREDVMHSHLGQALLEFGKKSGHPVDNILPGFLEGLASRIEKTEKEKNNLSDGELAKKKKSICREFLCLPVLESLFLQDYGKQEKTD